MGSSCSAKGLSSIGSNNLSTTFSGTIQDTGSISKIGTGTLTLNEREQLQRRHDRYGWDSPRE